jgi:hypothetical protein
MTTDYILVPRETLQQVLDSLGSFVSDHGWGQQDMDNMDSVIALLDAPCEPRGYWTLPTPPDAGRVPTT